MVILFWATTVSCKSISEINRLKSFCIIIITIKWDKSKGERVKDIHKSFLRLPATVTTTAEVRQLSLLTAKRLSFTSTM